MKSSAVTYVVTIIISTLISGCSGSTAGSKILDDANTGKELVSINGSQIREGYINVLAEINPRIKAQIGNPATRKQLLQNIVEQELMYQESIKRGLDKKKDVAQKAALYNKIIVSQALLEDELTEKAKKYYEDNKATEFTKVKIAQIQVNFLPEEEKPDPKKPAAAKEATPAQKEAALAKAKSIHAKVTSGGDFAKIAEELSEDKSTKKKGGDLGAISKNDKRLVRRNLEALGEAAFKLKNGDVSDPIESKTGYHIIKVLSEPQESPFSEAEKMIRFQLQKDVKEEIIGKLTKASNIKYADGEKPAATIPVKTEAIEPVEAQQAADTPEVPDTAKEAKPDEGNSFKPVLKKEEKKEEKKEVKNEAPNGHEGHDHN